MSFVGSTVNKVDKTGPHSRSYITINKDNCVVNTNIVLDINDNKAGNCEIKNYDTTYIYNHKSENNFIYHSKDFDIKTNNKIKIINKINSTFDKYLKETKDDIIITDLTDKDKDFKNTTISYHGYFYHAKKIYHVLTHQIVKNDLAFTFNKNLLILNDTDFNHFVQNIKKSFRQKVKEGFIIIKRKFPTRKSPTRQHESTAGGYREKYLKYKQKYIKLKQLLESQQ